jgi:hypothetical protein
MGIWGQTDPHDSGFPRERTLAGLSRPHGTSPARALAEQGAEIDSSAKRTRMRNTPPCGCLGPTRRALQILVCLCRAFCVHILSAETAQDAQKRSASGQDTRSLVCSSSLSSLQTCPFQPFVCKPHEGIAPSGPRFPARVCVSYSLAEIDLLYVLAPSNASHVESPPKQIQPTSQSLRCTPHSFPPL